MELLHLFNRSAKFRTNRLIVVTGRFKTPQQDNRRFIGRVVAIRQHPFAKFLCIRIAPFRDPLLGQFDARVAETIQRFAVKDLAVRRIWDHVRRQLILLNRSLIILVLVSTSARLNRRLSAHHIITTTGQFPCRHGFGGNCEGLPRERQGRGQDRDAQERCDGLCEWGFDHECKVLRVVGNWLG